VPSEERPSEPPPAATRPGDADDDRALDEWLEFQRHLGEHQAARRTHFASPLIPMEYLLLQALEAWARWPEIMELVTSTTAPEEIGERFRRPGFGVNATHLYCLGALPTGGCSRWAQLGVSRPDERDRLRTVMRFWRGTAEAWRGDGFSTAYAAGDVVRPYPRAVTDDLAGAAVGLTGDDARRRFRRSIATLVQHLFLVNMECRIGMGDSGPYPLPRERTLIVRELSGLSAGWLPWTDVAADVPTSDLVLALVYGPGVQHHVTDSATTFSVPEDPFPLLEAVALFASDGAGALTPLAIDALDPIVAAVEAAQRALYRRVVAWTWDRKVAAGALVYFAMIRPWAVAAGVDGAVDWTMPLAAVDVLPSLRASGAGPSTTDAHQGT
jgi:hypothetical protein